MRSPAEPDCQRRLPRVRLMHFDPWDRLRAMPHITVRWEDLPDDVMGYADFETATIVLAKGMTQAERRSTCWHEVTHLRRGTVPASLRDREERAVEASVARDLIPFGALVEAMLWSRNDHEIAEELTVDVALVRTRLHDLSDHETAELNRALDLGELLIP